MLVDINITGETYQSRSLPLSAQVTRNFYPEVQDNQATRSSFVLMPFPGYLFWGKSEYFVFSGASNTETFDVSAKETFPTGVAFKSDGTKMYVVGTSSDNVNEYDLSTAWDISTASFNQAMDISGKEINSTSIQFNTDGDKLYIAGNTSDSVHEYDLSTAWDVSSASFNQSLSLSRNIEAFFFGKSGEKLYTTDTVSQKIWELDLSTAYDISTASANQSLDISSNTPTSVGLDFSSNGKRVYVADNDNGSEGIDRYDLSTAWDISTATYRDTLDVSGTVGYITEARLGNDGAVLFIANNDDDTIYAYSSGSGLNNRGIFEHQGVLYSVNGINLYSVNSSGDHTLLGSGGEILGTDDCIFAGIGDNVVIVTEGKAFVYDGSTIDEVDDADLETPNGVAHLNNQIIYDGDGGRFASSDVGDATSIDGLNYATAESNADDLVRPYVLNQTLYLMGDRTIEQWWNSGSGSPPFDRIEGGIIPVGLKALLSVADNGDVMYFLADDLRIYAVSGSSKQILSTIPLANAVEGYSTVTDAIGTYFTLEGQGFYQITFPTEDKSWCFHEQSKQWFEVSSGNDGGRAIFNHAVQAYNKTIVADKANGNLYELDVETFNENGATIHRQRDTAPFHGGLIGRPGKWIEFNRVELHLETGVGDLTQTPNIILSWSDDGGRTFSTESWGTLNIGSAGDYQRKVEWFGLGGAYDRIFRIKASEAVRFSIYSMSAEIEVGI